MSDGMTIEELTASPGSDETDVRRLLDDSARLGSVDPGTARQLVLEARIRARAGGLRSLECEALYQLALLSHHADDNDEAFALASEAVTLAEPDELSVTLAWSLHLLGLIHYQASNFASALEHSLRALHIYRATDHMHDESRILHTIAAVYQAMADHDRAITTYRQALAVNEALGRSDIDAMVLGNLARLLGRRGRCAEAIDIGQAALDSAREHAPGLVGSVLADLAEAYMGVGDQSNAAACFALARDDWDRRRHSGGELTPVEELGVMLAEGRVALCSDRIREAITTLVAALDLADRTDNRQVELEIHDLLSSAYRRAGRFEEALEERERHFALHREIFTDSADLRLRTLQIAHDHQTARHEMEITRLTHSDLVAGFAAEHIDADAYHLEAFERLASLAELRGGNTTRHTSAVGDLAAEIGHAIGRAPDWCERLRLAARLHDIGKVAVADSTLLKPGPLTVEEFNEVKQHTVLGRRLLSGVSTELFALAAEAAWSHHEWWDGSGYPNGLAGEAIPLCGRIVAIADVFDSLATRRVYKREWNLAESVRFVASGSGSQFQPELVEAFVAVMAARHPGLADELA